jgi:hypothetical protein
MALISMAQRAKHDWYACPLLTASLFSFLIAEPGAMLEWKQFTSQPPAVRGSTSLPDLHLSPLNCITINPLHYGF